MQLIGTLNGSSLKRVSNHVKNKHKVFNTINADTYYKNSYHQYSLKDCPNNFNITYKSYDNEIEGIKHKEKNITGIMWHPEREEKIMQDDIDLIYEIFLNHY